MTKSLLIGGHGYIGSVLKQKLDNCIIFSGDIQDTDWKTLLGEVGSDSIYFLVAQTNAYNSNQDPIRDIKVNLLPLIRMMEAIRALQISPSVIFTSVATATGLVNDNLDNPITVYDIHKLTAEKYLYYYFFEHGIRSIAVRFPNIYGPSPISSPSGRGFINACIKKALRGEPVTLYEGFTNRIRDYLYIDDAVGALLCAGGQTLDGRSYGVGTCIGTTFKEILMMIAEFLPSIALTTTLPPPNLLTIENRDFVANNADFSEKFGWSPEVQLREGLQRTIEYYGNN